MVVGIGLAQNTHVDMVAFLQRERQSLPTVFRSFLIVVIGPPTAYVITVIDLLASTLLTYSQAAKLTMCAMRYIKTVFPSHEEYF